MESPDPSHGVRQGVADASELLEADGASLTILDLDDAGRNLHLRLDLEDASCADCVLPPEHLLTVVGDMITRRAGHPVAISLDDPRS